MSKINKNKEGKSSWSLALGDLVKRTKRNLENVNSNIGSNGPINDTDYDKRKEKIFLKTNTYKMLGIGRSSSAFGSRNTDGKFMISQGNKNLRDSNSSSSKMQIAASFDNDVGQPNFFVPKKDRPPKMPETFSYKNLSSPAFMSQTYGARLEKE
jgi:hypothetical protein